MVETRINKSDGSARIVLRPNNSASWPGNMKIVGSLALLAVYISSIYALQGLWLIFPFTGLSVAILAVCLYLRMRANINTEVITIDKTTVLVERGCYHAERAWKYHRLWSKFFVKEPDVRGFPKQVFIRSHGKELELGSFLNKKDKEILIKELKNVVYA